MHITWDFEPLLLKLLVQISRFLLQFDYSSFFQDLVDRPGRSIKIEDLIKIWALQKVESFDKR